MYRKLHCDFSNGPYMIAAATITSPSNNYGAAILFESGIYISLSAPARVYTMICSQRARCFNPGYIYIQETF